MVRFDVETVDIVQPAVIGFGDDRQREPHGGRADRSLFDLIGDDGVAHHADAVRIGDHHRSFQVSRLLDPVRARHLSVAIEREHAGKYRLGGIPAPGQDGSHAGADRPLADFKFAIARNQRAVPDLHAFHVGDRVPSTGRPLKRNSEVAGTRSGFLAMSEGRENGSGPDHDRYVPDMPRHDADTAFRVI